MKRYSNRQAQIMSLLWENDMLTVAQIQDKFKDKLHYNTISTFIRGLESIGAVNHIPKYKPYSYYAVKSREQYINDMLIDIISNYFNNEKDKLVNYILQQITIT